MVAKRIRYLIPYRLNGETKKIVNVGVNISTAPPPHDRVLGGERVIAPLKVIQGVHFLGICAAVEGVFYTDGSILSKNVPKMIRRKSNTFLLACQKISTLLRTAYVGVLCVATISVFKFICTRIGNTINL